MHRHLGTHTEAHTHTCRHVHTKARVHTHTDKHIPTAVSRALAHPQYFGSGPVLQDVLRAITPPPFALPCSSADARFLKILTGCADQLGDIYILCWASCYLNGPGDQILVDAICPDMALVKIKVKNRQRCFCLCPKKMEL